MDRISQLFEHFQFDYLASPLFPPRKSTSKHTMTTKLWSLINILTRDDDWWVYMSATWFLSLFTHQKPCLKICFFIPEKPQMLEVLVIYWPANILFEQIRPSFLLETQLLKYYDPKLLLHIDLDKDGGWPDYMSILWHITYEDMLFHTSKIVNSRGFGNLLTSQYLISTMLDLSNFDQ